MTIPNLPTVSVSDLLDAGIHFGHKTSRWNPKMAPYIYGVKDNIHIIDLQQTVPLLQVALGKIYEVVKNNGKVLFVSSKVQASDLIAEYAGKCDQYYINHRWLGGILTNWNTVSGSIKKLENIEQTLANEEDLASYTKKEILDLTRRQDKLIKSFAGIRNIGGSPDLIVIIDTNKEHLAVKEAVKLGIPLVAVVDSNSDPDNIDFPIPGNDDAIRSIRLYCSLFADAALAGIQDSLRDSGVDIGSAEKIKPENSMEGVEKIEKVAKVSKAKVVAEPPKTPKIAPKIAVTQEASSNNAEEKKAEGEEKPVKKLEKSVKTEGAKPIKTEKPVAEKLIKAVKTTKAKA